MIEIYMLSHVDTSKSYIGLTSRKAYGNGLLISSAKKKHGKCAFLPVILARTESKEEADKLERFYISFFDTLHPHGYNLALGGDGGAIHTTEMKQRLSITLKQGYKDNPDRAKKISEKLKGRPSPTKGKVVSAGTKAKISATLRNRAFKHSEETKEALRQRFVGRIMSEDTKAKMSASAKIRASSPEFIARITGANNPMKRPDIAERNGAAQRGKKLTEQHKIKIGLAGIGRVGANKGRTFSPETRAKMSASGKGRVFSADHKRKISEAVKVSAVKKKEELA